jgi:hypothetical protein
VNFGEVFYAKGIDMKSNGKPQRGIKYDYGTLLLMAILLLGISQGIESIQTPVGNFIRGVVVGKSIACSIIGLVLYAYSSKEG